MPRQRFIRTPLRLRCESRTQQSTTAGSIRVRLQPGPNFAVSQMGENAKGMRGTWLGGGDMKDNLDSFNAEIQSLKLSPEEAARLTFTGKMATKYGFKGKVDIVKAEGTPGNYTKVEVVFWR